ncbi:MAG: glycosyltransferase, partial [Candidatus Marinimicrobia bacterium]|nr:glycosyltransferase [Candidatus Neomarinimicrobiota bacterium]
MKILFLTDYPLTWDKSPPSRLLYLSREFLIARHNVRVVGSQTDSPAEIDGIKMVTLPYPANYGIKRASFALRREIRQHIRWCDAIIVRGYWIGIFALIYAAFSGVKIRIYDFHGFAWKEQFGKHRIMRSISTYLIELLMLSLSSAILAVSKGVKNDLSRYAKQKAIVVENGVVLEEFQVKPSSQKIEELKKRFYIPDKKPVFGIVASFGPWIDVQCVIESAGKLQDEVEIILVGSGPG